MGLGDIFKATENKKLKERIAELEQFLTPEMQQIDNAQKRLEELKTSITQAQDKLSELISQKNTIQNDISAAQQELIQVNDTILLQSFGLYEPCFDFANSDGYRDELANIRNQQKELIRNGLAATGNTNWSVNNSTAKGQKMVKDMQKLLIRAFNSECDELVSKVKFNNIQSAQKRMAASRDAISKLGSIMQISISSEYFNLKIDELHLAYEYQLKKQDEKEEQRRIREELREQAKLEKELEDARRNIVKEQTHYQNALDKLKKQLESTSDESQRLALEEKKTELESHLDELETSLEEVDYRAANQKAGYVYIISNIGAFGENIYKIGMTRRLEPLERVHELGGASVPFPFDVHAMIFSDNAPALEAALHRAFDSKKVNMVNTRREFFNVTLSEIESVVRANYDKSVEFTEFPPAEQYRQSLKMRENMEG